MTDDQYQNRRSWLIDTAETSADKKRLKAELAKLDAMYKAQQEAIKKLASKTVRGKSSVAKSPDQAKLRNTNKFSPEMTPKDIATKKKLEKKYGKPYG